VIERAAVTESAATTGHRPTPVVVVALWGAPGPSDQVCPLTVGRKQRTKWPPAATSRSAARREPRTAGAPWLDRNRAAAVVDTRIIRRASHRCRRLWFERKSKHLTRATALKAFNYQSVRPSSTPYE